MTSAVNSRDFMTRWRYVESKYIGLPVIDSLQVRMNQVRNLKGQIIQIGSGDSKVFKKIGIEETSTSGLKTGIIFEQREDDNYNFYNTVKNVAFSYPDFAAKYPVKMQATYTRYNFKVTLTDVNEGTYTCKIPTRDNRLLNKDGPFDIFCIPYTDDILIKQGENAPIVGNKLLAMQLASEIGRAMATNIYDIQLLPYCPMTGYTYDS